MKVEEDMIEGLTPLHKDKQKVTILALGAGMIGCDVRKLAVTRGLLCTSDGLRLAYSEPRGRKKFPWLPLLQKGVIVLKGHVEDRDIFEGHYKWETDGPFTATRMLLDGTGGKFLELEDGADGLINYLKDHILLHTLRDDVSIKLVRPNKDGGGGMDFLPSPDYPDFKEKLLDALSPWFVPLEPAKPKEPEPVALLTERMKEKLKAHNGDDPPHPIYKIFTPEGAATWLLCSMEEDGDTMWAVCDLGMGCVEYGTVSLSEIAALRGPLLKLPPEVDRHFDGKNLTVRELIQKSSLLG